MRAVPPLSPLLSFVRRLVASALQMPTGAVYGFGLQCGRAFALALPRVVVFRYGMAPARAWGYLHRLGMAAHGHVKALRRKAALEINRSKVFV
jgi:hypothetical protein